MKDDIETRRAPVQGFSSGIPWAVHCKAYDGYVARYGNTQSVETLAARGGFGVGELDMFYPDWRKESDALDRLQARVAELGKERDEALTYATALLVAFVNRHCSPIPDWKPLPDLAGVLSQLDNATTVVRDVEADRDSLRAKLKRAKEALGPFCNAADKMKKVRDDRPLWDALNSAWPQRNVIPLIVGDLRRARAVLAELSADAPAQQTYEAPRNLNDKLVVRGVGRLADEPRSMIVALNEIPTDDEIRAMHDFLRNWPAQQKQDQR